MIKPTLRKLRDRLLTGLATKDDLKHLYNQIAGLEQIRSAMEGKPVMRPMRGWAISPDAMAWVLAALQEHPEPTVIEFGCGQSTVVLAATLKQRGGRLISVEHDLEYLSATRKQVEASALGSGVQFITAPLVERPDGIRSYDVTQLPEAAVDLVLIDGPPSIIYGAETRLIPLRWAADHLTPKGSIFLDDFNRPSEHGCVGTITDEVEGLTTISRSAEKGLVELRFE